MPTAKRLSLGRNLRILKRGFGVASDKALQKSLTNDEAFRVARRSAMNVLRAKLTGQRRVGAETRGVVFKVFEDNPSVSSAEMRRILDGQLKAEGQRLTQPQSRAVEELLGRLQENWRRIQSLQLDRKPQDGASFIYSLLTHRVGPQGASHEIRLTGPVKLTITPFAIVVGFWPEDYLAHFMGTHTVPTKTGVSLRGAHGHTFYPTINGRTVPVVVMPSEAGELVVSHQPKSGGGEAREVGTISVDPQAIEAHEMQHAKSIAAGRMIHSFKWVEKIMPGHPEFERAKAEYKSAISMHVLDELAARLHDANSAQEAVEGAGVMIRTVFQPRNELNQRFLAPIEARWIYQLPALVGRALRHVQAYELIELARDPRMDAWRFYRTLRSIARPRK